MSKIADKIAMSERKLKETKAKFEADKADLTSLIKQRAKLESEAILDNNRQDGKRIAEIDRQRDKLRSQIEIYPSLIKEIESRLEGLRKEKEEGILRENLTKQRKIGHKVEELSQELGTLLERANDTNIKLQKCRSIYLKLGELTNQDVITKPITSGSHGWLRVLTAVINSEVKGGGGRISPRYMGGPAPPI